MYQTTSMVKVKGGVLENIALDLAEIFILLPLLKFYLHHVKLIYDGWG